jgi:hypothetical protein
MARGMFDLPASPCGTTLFYERAFRQPLGGNEFQISDPLAALDLVNLLRTSQGAIRKGGLSIHLNCVVCPFHVHLVVAGIDTNSLFGVICMCTRWVNIEDHL